MILDDLPCPEPKTKVFASMLSALGVEKGCLVALEEHNDNVYRSGRNIPDTDIRVVDDLSAFDVLRRPKLVFTRPAFERLAQASRGARDSKANE
jgi:large subunit ribosomal protein L4